MAITLDSTGVSASSGSTTATLASFTVASGATLLVVASSVYGSGDSISTISWNGSTTGWVKAIRENDGVHNPGSEIWYLLTPTAATSSIVVTLASGPANVWGFAAYSLKGTSGAPYGGTGKVATGATSVSDSINIVTSGDWMIDVVVTSGQVVTAGGSQTAQTIPNLLAGGAGSSRLTSAATGSTAMSWTFGFTNVSHSVVAIPQLVVSAVTVQDRISVGTIFGAQTPTGHVGGF